MSQEYSITGDSKFSIGEQLRLFAFNIDTMPPPEILEAVNRELSKKERLKILLKGELDFHGENSRYASHDLHAFAAKFPPQLPRAFIRGLTKESEIVLDPMMGSGTTIVEALIEDRIAIGIDIDPLALLLCSVKATPLDVELLRRSGSFVIQRASELINTHSPVIEKHIATQFDKPTKNFIDYWFFPNTQRELISLYIAIHELDDHTSIRFLELTFSSIIITKSGGVSRARDLAHSRPHLDKSKMPKNAIEQFSIKFRKNLNSIAELNRKFYSTNTIEGDARDIPLANEVIDLIVTSPPYANAIDYMRAHKFSLVWSGKKIGELTELRSKYIGSERIGDISNIPLTGQAENIIKNLSLRDMKKSSILRKYFAEMKCAVSEMYRVLKHDSAAIIVIGTSTMRDLDVETHLCIADGAKETGFELVGITKRILDRNKRMMPARFGGKGNSLIEQRMHDEFVIGLYKK